MNKAILCGRLTADPDVRFSTGEEPMAIARFTLAVDRRKKEGEQNADFISCVAFKKQGEFAEKYCKKGTKIILEGHIQTGAYTNKQGVKVYTTEVIADAMEFAESKKAAEEEKPNNGFDNIADIPEELPFD